MQSNATAIANLTRTIAKQHQPKRKNVTPVEHCLKASFDLQPEEDSPQALKTALEKLKNIPHTNEC